MNGGTARHLSPLLHADRGESWPENAHALRRLPGSVKALGFKNMANVIGKMWKMIAKQRDFDGFTMIYIGVFRFSEKSMYYSFMMQSMKLHSFQREELRGEIRRTGNSDRFEFVTYKTTGNWLIQYNIHKKTDGTESSFILFIFHECHNHIPIQMLFSLIFPITLPSDWETLVTGVQKSMLADPASETTKVLGQFGTYAPCMESLVIFTNIYPQQVRRVPEFKYT